MRIHCICKCVGFVLFRLFAFALSHLGKFKESLCGARSPRHPSRHCHRHVPCTSIFVRNPQLAFLYGYVCIYEIHEHTHTNKPRKGGGEESRGAGYASTWRRSCIPRSLHHPRPRSKMWWRPLRCRTGFQLTWINPPPPVFAFTDGQAIGSRAPCNEVHLHPLRTQEIRSRHHAVGRTADHLPGACVCVPSPSALSVASRYSPAARRFVRAPIRNNSPALRR